MLTATFRADQSRCKRKQSSCTESYQNSISQLSFDPTPIPSLNKIEAIEIRLSLQLTTLLKNLYCQLCFRFASPRRNATHQNIHSLALFSDANYQTTKLSKIDSPELSIARSPRDAAREQPDDANHFGSIRLVASERRKIPRSISPVNRA